MIRVEKLNAVYDIEEKDLNNWIAKGYKKVKKAIQLEGNKQKLTLDDLKKIADELKIEYAPNISYNKLLQKINEKKEAQ